MSDVHSTRRYERYENDDPKPVPATPQLTPAQSAAAKWDEEDRRRLWRQVTNLGETAKRNNIIFAMSVSIGILLTVFCWFEGSASDERVSAKQKAMADQVQEFYFALERTAADVDDNRKATAVASTEFVGNEEWIDDRKGAYNSYWWYMPAPSEIGEYDGDVIIQRFDELRVVHVMHPLRKGPFKGCKENTLIYLDDAAYAITKEMKTLDVARIEAELAKAKKPDVGTNESATRGESPKLEGNDASGIVGLLGEAVRKLTAPKPLSLAELRQYDGEEIVCSATSGAKPNVTYGIFVKHLPYAYGKHELIALSLSAEDFALMKGMKTLNVRVLEDAHRSR
ncbi:MAG: hypothetical protein Q7R85_02785 [bacterium]|nr:hypothetical protein [bacterium]